MLKLAKKFEDLIKILNMYPKNGIPNSAEIDIIRASQSKWIRQFSISANEKVIAHTKVVAPNGAYWQDFLPENEGKLLKQHILYIHGGGLVFYELEDFTSLLQYWVMKVGANVTGFGYPKAPEHSYNVIIESLAQAIKLRLDDIPSTTPIYLIGDSIGAYMALYVCLTFFPRRIQRLILINPLLEQGGNRSSFFRYGKNYFLDQDFIIWFKKLAASNNVDRALFEPLQLNEQQLDLLPEVYLYTAEFDVLRDEAFAWKKYLRAKHKKIYHYNFKNLPHDFCLYAGYVPEALMAVNKIAKSFF